MSPLRQPMVAALELNGKSPASVEAYVREVAQERKATCQASEILPQPNVHVGCADTFPGPEVPQGRRCQGVGDDLQAGVLSSMTDQEITDFSILQEQLAAKEAQCKDLHKQLHDLRTRAQILQNKLSAVSEIVREDLQDDLCNAQESSPMQANPDQPSGGSGGPSWRTTLQLP